MPSAAERPTALWPFGRVDAATAFWNVEGVALARREPRTREFRVDDFGAPAYPELVLCVTRRTLRERPGLVRGAIRGLRRGYDAAEADPGAAIAAMTRAEPGLDPAVLREQLAAVAPAFRAPGRPYGRLDRQTLERWSAWDVEHGILERPVDVARAFDAQAG